MPVIRSLRHLCLAVCAAAGVARNVQRGCVTKRFVVLTGCSGSGGTQRAFSIRCLCQANSFMFFSVKLWVFFAESRVTEACCSAAGTGRLPRLPAAAGWSCRCPRPRSSGRGLTPSPGPLEEQILRSWTEGGVAYHRSELNEV